MIVRFIRGEPILADEESRLEYRSRMGRAVQGCDWTLLSFAEMSTHVHKSFIAGMDPFEAWTRPLHTGFARWVNARGQRSPRALGPILADRPKTLHLPRARAPWLIAYHHNNPPRAGMVSRAEDSTRTSHRAFIGLDPAPPFLDVPLALELCGFGDDGHGRAAFQRWVDLRRSDPYDAVLEGDLCEPSREVRRIHGAGANLTTPMYEEEGVEIPVETARDGTPASPFDGPPIAVLRVVAETLGLSVDRLQSRRRDRTTSLARKVAVLAWLGSGRRAGEIATVLRIGPSAVSNIAVRAEGDEVAGSLAQRVRHQLTRPVLRRIA